LEQVSKDILKKCGGVPLAIISIASLLASHQKHIRAKDQWHIVLNSIGHGLTDGGNVQDMQRILSFSYYDLPSHLKACLVYLSIFPEDYEIRRGRLIWRWIAEGLIQHKKDEDNLFELGDTYFQDLVNRSMIQPIGINDEGKALACRVHDMVLHLIRSISRQENFVTIWDGTGQSKSLLGTREQDSQAIPPKHHHRTLSSYEPAASEVLHSLQCYYCYRLDAIPFTIPSSTCAGSRRL
jgi:hypothetical protein